VIHDHQIADHRNETIGQKKPEGSVRSGPPISDHAKYMELKMKSGTDFDRAYVQRLEPRVMQFLLRYNFREKRREGFLLLKWQTLQSQRTLLPALPVTVVVIIHIDGLCKNSALCMAVASRPGLLPGVEPARRQICVTSLMHSCCSHCH